MERRDVIHAEEVLRPVTYQTEMNDSIEEVFVKLCGHREDFPGPLSLRTYPRKQIELARHPEYEMTVVIDPAKEGLTINYRIIPSREDEVVYMNEGNTILVPEPDADVNLLLKQAEYYERIVKQIRSYVRPARHCRR